MLSKDIRPDDAAGLRRRAEEMTRVKAALSIEYLKTLSLEEIQSLIHELEVHQIELGMQNEELRTAYANLNDVRDRYFNLYNLAPVGYITLRDNGLIQEANLHFATLLKKPRSALIGEQLTRFVFLDDQDRFYLHFDRLCQTRSAQSFQIRMTRSDGTPFWVQVNATAFPDAVCDETYFQVILRDITDFKIAEEALQKSENRFFSLAKLAPVIIYLVDIAGNCCYVNDRWCEITGKKPEEAVGCGWMEALHPDDRQEFSLFWNRMKAFKGTQELEHRILSKEGKTTDAHCIASPQMDAQGNITGYIGVCLDITGRRLADAEKNMAKLSTQLLQVLETEQRRISIDLHDQTGQDMGVLKLQIADIQDRLPNDQIELKKKCQKILEYTDKIICDIRRIYRNLNPEMLETLGLKGALRRLFRIFYEQSGIHIKADIHDLSKITRNEHQHGVYRIIQESLTNVLKHSHAHAVDICADYSNGMIHLKIQDDGRGFDTHRAFSTLTDRNCGMGLSILSLRAKMIDARFNLSSQPDQGTTIELILPIAPPPPTHTHTRTHAFRVKGVCYKNEPLHYCFGR